MSHDPETPAKADPPTIRPAATDRRSPPGWLTAMVGLNLALLLASAGLLGYGVYQQRQGLAAEEPAKQAAKQATRAEGEIKPEVGKLEGEVKDLSRKVEDRPPPPNYAPQIKGLEDRVAEVGKSLADLRDQIASNGKTLENLTRGNGLEGSPRFAAVEKRVGELAAAMEVVRSKLAIKITPAALANDEFDQASALFKEGKYAEARDAFVRLQSVTPDDARVWYYSAVANGLATRDWKGESERWVAAGMAREKAGKPDRATVDAAFATLTTATGKDWLSFYRNRAAGSPETR